MAIPKEPRQLMINIMYLVLTALLALNVSAEIFNAFAMVDKGLTSANASLDEKNEALPTVIKDRAKKNEAFQTYADRVDVARNISAQASDYIDKLVEDLIDEAGETDGVVDDLDYVFDENGNKILRGLKDYDATTRLLVDQGLGMELRDKMIEVKGQFLELIDTAEQSSFDSKIPIVIDDQAWRNSLSKRENWADFTFNHMPLGATMPIFTKFKNDIKSSEAAILNYLMTKVGGEEVVLDEFKVVSAPKKTYIIKGEKFETDIFLSASASRGNNTGLSISVNGQRLTPNAEGVAPFSANASSTGKKTYSATISVENPVTGEVKTYKNDFEYEVGERSVAISATKMNVFYIGVDNPVEVSAAGVNSTLINVSMSGQGGGTIKKNSDGTFTVVVKTPTKKGETANVNVAAPGLNASKAFRVKRIPTPVAKLSNDTGGSMASGTFKAQGGVRADLENFDFDARCEISGFRLVRVPKRQDPEFAVNPGGSYKNDATKLVNKAKAGDRFFFENVKCKCPGDPAPRKTNELVFTIN